MIRTTQNILPQGTKCKINYPKTLRLGSAEFDEFHDNLNNKIVEIYGYSYLTHDYVVKLPDDFKYAGFDYLFTSVSGIYLEPIST